MKLLLDLGNSRLKWATESHGQMSFVTAMNYRQPDFLPNLTLHWQDLQSPKVIAIASVSSQNMLQELLQLSQKLWPQAKLILPKPAAFAFGVKNAYAQPEKLGVDRWLALMAAHKHYPQHKCVVDCGTAITIDVLQADGLHLGGVITPGLRLMKQALATNTADLELNSHPYQAAFGQDTAAAIANGVLWAAAGVVAQAWRTLDDGYQLIMTGGDAEVIAGVLSIPILLDHELVLKGLSVYCQAE